MVVRRYEFYVRVARTVSHESLLPREHKIHIFSPPCNVLFIIKKVLMMAFSMIF